MSNKTSLRKVYKQKRQKLTLEEIEDRSLAIANLALSLPIWEKKYYHLFLSIAKQKEINTEYFLHILQGKDKSVVLSKTMFKQGLLKHFLLEENTVITVSDYGIPEPVSGLEVPPEMIDVVFVPLLVFDLNGHRIGYGKGFYDRFLQKCREDALFVGLSLFEAEEESIHAETTDVPLHFCITPKKIYRFNKSD